MRFRAGCHAVAFLAVGLILAGCASRRGQLRNSGAAARESEAGSARSRLSDADVQRLAQAHALFAESVLHDLNDEPGPAIEKLDAAFHLDPGDPQLALELARRYELQTNIDQAIKVLKLAVDKSTNPERIYARLGGIYSVQGQTNLAIRADENAIKADPTSLIGYHNLFVVLLQAKRPDDAWRVLERAAAVSDPPADFLADLSLLFASFAKTTPARAADCRQQSLQLLNRAATLHPTNELVLLKIADGFTSYDATTNALPVYEQLLQSQAVSGLFRDGLRAKLTALYLQQGMRDKATAQLKAIVEDDPSNAQAYFQLSQLALSETNYPEAADYLKRALLFRPEVESGYYDLAGLQLDADDARGALDTLERARSRFSPSFRGEYLAAIALTRLKQYQQALKRYTAAEVIARATNTNALNQYFYFQVGAASERSGDIKSAEKYFQKCLELAPDFAECLNYLGYMWADRGENLEKAHDMIARAVKAEPDNDAFLDSLGWVLFKEGKYAEALQWLQKASARAKEPDAEMLDHLGEVYQKLGQMDKAVESWKKSLAVESSEAIQKKLDAAEGK